MSNAFGGLARLSRPMQKYDMLYLGTEVSHPLLLVTYLNIENLLG